MSEMLTDTELSAIRARCEAATPGPWDIDSGWGFVHSPSIMVGPIINNDGDSWNHVDTSFIAHARTDIPTLLAHIEEQKAALSKAEADKSALVEALEEMVAIAEAIAVWESTPENADGPLIKAHAVLASIKAQP